jgi:hypothetical protein
VFSREGEATATCAICGNEVVPTREFKVTAGKPQWREWLGERRQWLCKGPATGGSGQGRGFGTWCLSEGAGKRDIAPRTAGSGLRYDFTFSTAKRGVRTETRWVRDSNSSYVKCIGHSFLRKGSKEE